MSYIYISSGYFGSQVLSALPTKPSLIITQPDRLGGRGMKTLMATPVKKMATKLNVPHVEAKNKQELTELVANNKDKVILLCDFGMIIPDDALSKASYGIWNIHPSLLPAYRGATPIQSALSNGETHTGVSIIQMDSLVDHGPLLSQQQVQIDVNDTTMSLMEKSAKIGADMFVHLLENPETTLNNKKVQDHAHATHTKKLNKQYGYVQLEALTTYLSPLFSKYNLTHKLSKATDVQQMEARALHNKIRALQPWPGVWAYLPDQKLIKILKSAFSPETDTLTILEVGIDGKLYRLK